MARAEVRAHDRASARDGRRRSTSPSTSATSPSATFCLPSEARFVNQISVTPGPFSAPGDSGSLIVTQGGEPAGRRCSSPAATGSRSGTRSTPSCSGSTSRSTAAPPGDGPPGAPTGLSATAGDASRSPVSWTAPSFDGGSPITGYKRLSRHEPGRRDLLATVSATRTSYRRLGPDERDDLLLQGVGRERERRGPASNEASATPTALVPPERAARRSSTTSTALTRTRSRTRAGGRTESRGSGESGLYVTSNWLACSKSTTCTAWRNNAQYGPDVEVWARISVLPGDGNQLRLYARLQQPGTRRLRRLHAAPEPACRDRPDPLRAGRQRELRPPC